MLDLSKIRAITLDLDDTLWPVWPVIGRAEAVLLDWLRRHAPGAAALSATPQALREIRNRMSALRPDLGHDLSALRRESIRLLLEQAGEDPALAEPAFEVFFDERQRVDLFDDALPALARLSARFALVAVSNGNADVHRVGVGRHFKAVVSAREAGVAKPDPRIYHLAALAAGVSAAQVLHVGDDAVLDVGGAHAAGMQVAWVNRAGHAWPDEAKAPHLSVPDLVALCEALGL